MYSPYPYSLDPSNRVTCFLSILSTFSLFFFFFFQAEDGIRDHCVTGVQTCALPISFPPSLDRVGSDFRHYEMDGERRASRRALVGAQCRRPRRSRRTVTVAASPRR